MRSGFVAHRSYSICRAPLLPLFARELGAGPALVGFVMGASTLTGAYITDLTRRARYGAAHGVVGTIYDIGDALGPPFQRAFSSRGRATRTCSR